MILTDKNLKEIFVMFKSDTAWYFDGVVKLKDVPVGNEYKMPLYDWILEFDDINKNILRVSLVGLLNEFLNIKKIKIEIKSKTNSWG